MLVLSRKLNQAVSFPNLDITIEITRIRGSTVCLGIEAPKDVQILRAELPSLGHSSAEAKLKEVDSVEASHKTDLTLDVQHALRRRFNAMSLHLRMMKEHRQAQSPIESELLISALEELRVIEELLTVEENQVHEVHCAAV